MKKIMMDNNFNYKVDRIGNMTPNDGDFIWEYRTRNERKSITTTIDIIVSNGYQKLFSINGVPNIPNIRIKNFD